MKEKLEIEKIKDPIKIEFSLKSEKDLKRVEEELRDLFGPDGSEQFVFVLKSIADEDFVNQCNKATQKFGRELGENFGGEESFYDLAESSRFVEAQSQSPLKNKCRSAESHSVAIIENNGEKSIVVDLTYHTVSSSNKSLCIKVDGNVDDALKVLNEHYGGSWSAEFEFDKETKNFVFQD